MHRQRGEVLKWVGICLVLLLVGWYIWQNYVADSHGWAELAHMNGVAQQGVSGGVNTNGNAHSSVNPKGGSSVSQQTTANGGQTSVNAQSNAERKIAVHAAGAVRNPGVYYLPGDARVVDLIKAAGGATGSAELNELNLAQPIFDGDKVFVPYRVAGGTGAVSGAGGIYHSTGSVGSGGSGGSGGNTGGSSGGWYSTSSGGGQSRSSGYGSGGSSQGSANSRGKVNINTASVDELMTLPGIGSSKAAAIIQYREEKGYFRKPEDLVAVSGIGEKTLAKLLDLITI